MSLKECCNRIDQFIEADEFASSAGVILPVGGGPRMGKGSSSDMHPRVLIVDDDPMLQKLLGSHLSTAGYQVIEAASGAEGLEILRSQGPRIAFVDYDMPGINGVEFCRLVREDKRIPFAHVVILTAHVDRALTIAALDAGANDFMTKPFHRGELLARLRAGERAVRMYNEAAQAALLQSELTHLRSAVTNMEQVLTSVARELQNPIASFRNISEILSHSSARAAEEWGPYLTQMNQGVQQLSQTVDELLDMTRLNSGQGHWHWSKFALEPLCRDAMKQIEPLLQSRPVQLACVIDPAGFEMRGDRIAIRRFLLNLLGNCCKHTETGSLHLKVRSLAQDGHQWVELQILDTGKTAAADVLNQLCESPNSPPDAPAAHGTPSLSVAACKRIVEVHGGHMKIASTAENGTCITVTLRSDLESPLPLDATPLPAAANAA